MMIDDNVLARNHILVSTFLIGGASEKRLPDLHLQPDGQSPEFFTFPIPKIFLAANSLSWYSQIVERRVSVMTETHFDRDHGRITSILKDSVSADSAWRTALQSEFQNCLKDTDGKILPLPICRSVLDSFSAIISQSRVWNIKAVASLANKKSPDVITY